MILKVGGSVFDKLSEVLEALAGRRALIVPGGWRFADLVREVYSSFSLSEDAAHWMAVLAMNQYGYLISDFGAELIEPEDFDFEYKGVCVILPYRLLKKYDELPHSWSVTSDSIAAWMAHKLGENLVIKVTAAGGIFVNGKLLEVVEASKLPANDVVDEYLPKLLRNHGIDFFVTDVEGLKSYILRGRARGTLIVGR
ncbi:MAG: uridylate kinase [Archaeoglobaceae archaeon]